MTVQKILGPQLPLPREEYLQAAPEQTGVAEMDQRRRQQTLATSMPFMGHGDGKHKDNHTTINSSHHTPHASGSKKWSFGRLFRRKKENDSNSSSEEDRKAGFLPEQKKVRSSKSSKHKQRASKLTAGGFDHIVVNPRQHIDNEFFLPVETVSNNGNGRLKAAKSRSTQRLAGQQLLGSGSSGEEEAEMISLNSSTFSKYRSDESLHSGNMLQSAAHSRRSRAARNERYYKRLSRDGEVSNCQIPVQVYHAMNRQQQLEHQRQWQQQLQQQMKPQLQNNMSDKKRSISYDSQIHLQNINGRLQNKPLPPPPPPRDPLRRLNMGSEAELRPLSYAGDQLKTAQAYTSKPMVAYSTPTKATPRMNARCVSDEKIWDSVIYAPHYQSAQALNMSEPFTRKSRFASHAERAAHPSKQSLPNGIEFHYVADASPRSRKPIHLLQAQPETKNGITCSSLSLDHNSVDHPEAGMRRITQNGLPQVQNNNRISASTSNLRATDFWKRIDANAQQRGRASARALAPENQKRSVSSSLAGELRQFPIYAEVHKPPAVQNSMDEVDNVICGSLHIKPNSKNMENYVEIKSNKDMLKSRSMPNHYKTVQNNTNSNKYEQYVAELREKQKHALATPPPMPLQRKLAFAEAANNLYVTRKKPANLEEAISELEAIYKSLGLSEPPAKVEIREEAAKEAERAALKRGAETNVLAFDKFALAHADEYDDKESSGGEPDPIRDDVAYRNIKLANLQHKTSDKQPPFGIPLGPIVPAPQTDYLHVEPIPLQCHDTNQQSPDVIKDDLAVRALRKDPLGSKERAPEPKMLRGAPKKLRATRTQSANIYNLIQRDAAKPSGGDLNSYLELSKNIDRYGSMSDIPKQSDNDIPNTLKLLRSLREQERVEQLQQENRKTSQGGAIFQLPSKLKQEHENLQKAPVPLPRKSITPEPPQNNNNQIEEALNKIAKDAQESSVKLSKELQELRKEAIVTYSRAKPLVTALPCAEEQKLEQDLQEIEAVSEAAKRCGQMLLETLSDVCDNEVASSAKQRKLQTEGKLIKAIDQVSEAANAVCEKIFKDIGHKETPAVPSEQNLVLPSLLKRLDPVLGDKTEFVAQRAMQRLGELAADYDNLSGHTEQTNVTCTRSMPNINADSLIYTVAEKQKIPQSAPQAEIEEIDKIMQECEAQVRETTKQQQQQQQQNMSSSSDCLAKSASSTASRRQSSSITSFNPYSSSDYVKSPSSEFHAPSTDPIKTFSTTSYDVHSSPQTMNTNTTNSTFSYTPSPPFAAIQNDEPDNNNNNYNQNNSNLIKDGSSQERSRTNSHSQYNSADELEMIFGQQQQQQKQQRQNATTGSSDNQAISTNLLQKSDTANLSCQQHRDLNQTKLSTTRKLPRSYEGHHPDFKHHAGSAYYTDINLRIHTPKPNDITALNENYRSVYDKPSKRFPKFSTPTKLPVFPTPSVHEKEIKGDKEQEKEKTRSPAFFGGISAENKHGTLDNYEQKFTTTYVNPIKGDLAVAVSQSSPQPHVVKPKTDSAVSPIIAKIVPVDSVVEPSEASEKTANRSRSKQRFAGRKRVLRVRSESRTISALYDIICKEKGLVIETDDEQDSSPTTSKSSLKTSLNHQDNSHNETEESHKQNLIRKNQTTDSDLMLGTMNKKIPIRKTTQSNSNQYLSNRISSVDALINKNNNNNYNNDSNNKRGLAYKNKQTKYDVTSDNDDEDYDVKSNETVSRRQRLLKSSQKRRTNTIELGLMGTSSNAYKSADNNTVEISEYQFNTNDLPSTSTHNHDCLSSTHYLLLQNNGNAYGSDHQYASCPIETNPSSNYNEKTPIQNYNDNVTAVSSKVDGAPKVKRFITRPSQQPSSAKKSSRSRSVSHTRALNGHISTRENLAAAPESGSLSSTPTSPMNERGRLAVKNAIARVRSRSASVMKSQTTFQTPTHVNKEPLQKLKASRQQENHSIASLEPTATTTCTTKDTPPITTIATSTVYNHDTPCRFPLQSLLYPRKNEQQQQQHNRRCVNNSNEKYNCCYKNNQNTARLESTLQLPVFVRTTKTTRLRVAAALDKRKDELLSTPTLSRQRRLRSTSAQKDRLTSGSSTEKENELLRPRSLSLETQNESKNVRIKLVPTVSVQMSQKLQEVHYNGNGCLEAQTSDPEAVEQFTIRLNATISENNETEHRPRCSTMIANGVSRLPQPALNLSPVPVLKLLENSTNNEERDKSSKRKSNLNRALNEESTQFSDRRQRLLDDFTMRKQNELFLETNDTITIADNSRLVARTGIPKPISADRSPHVKESCDSLSFDGAKTRSEKPRSDLAEIRKIAQMANEPLNRNSSPVLAVNELRDSIERIRVSHERELQLQSPVKHATFLNDPVLHMSNNQRILKARSMDREADDPKLSPILRRKSTDDPSNDSGVVTTNNSFVNAPVHNHIVSILKKKDHSQLLAGECSSASSNSSPVTFSANVSENCSQLKQKRAGILKKRSSLDESRYYSRSHSPDERSIQICIKSARRNSLEDSAAISNTGIHGILKQSSYDSSKSDGCLSANSETQHPHGILKKKDSTSTPSDCVGCSNTTSKHVSISQAVILATAELNRDALEKVTADVDFYASNEEIEIRPILKMENSSTEENARSKPKPILKKKSSVDSDEQEIRPILKTSRKSSREEYDLNDSQSDEATSSVRRILKTESPTKCLTLNVDNNGGFNHTPVTGKSSPNPLKRRTRSLERQEVAVMDLAEALNAIATSKALPMPKVPPPPTTSVAERIKYMERYLITDVEENSMRSLPTLVNTTWQPDTMTVTRPGLLKREVFRERYKTQPITNQERNLFKIEYNSTIPVTEHPIFATIPTPSVATSTSYANQRRSAFRSISSVNSFNNVPFESQHHPKSTDWLDTKSSSSQSNSCQIPVPNNMNTETSDALKLKSNSVRSRANMFQQLQNQPTTTTDNNDVISNAPVDDTAQTSIKKMQHSTQPNQMDAHNSSNMHIDDDEVASKHNVARSRSGFVNVMPTNMARELNDRLKSGTGNLRKSATTDIKTATEKAEKALTQHSDAVNLVRNLSHLGNTEMRQMSSMQADGASTSEGESSGGREITEIIKNSGVARRRKLNDGILLSQKASNEGENRKVPAGAIRLLPPLTGAVKLRNVASKEHETAKNSKNFTVIEPIKTEKNNTESSASVVAAKGTTSPAKPCPGFLTQPSEMGPDQRNSIINENSSIAERLAALQKSGEDEWKKRISKRDEVEQIKSCRDNLANENISLAPSIKDKPAQSSLIIEGDKVSERLGKLKVSAENWKNRVEPKDAKKFTAAARLQQQQQKQQAETIKTPKPQSKDLGDGKCIPLVFRSGDVTLLGLAKSSSMTLSGPNGNVPDALEETQLTFSHEEKFHAKFSRSQSLADSDNKNSLTSDSEQLDEQPEPQSKVAQNDKTQSKSKSYIDKDFEGFFQTNNGNSGKSIPDINISDFDAIKPTKRLSALRHIAGPKGRRPARNPIKNLATRNDVANSYEELSKNSIGTFAPETVAALAATEDFSNIKLKSSRTPLNTHWVPYQMKMLVHIKGRGNVQVRLVEPTYSSINTGDCFVLITPTALYLYKGEFANVIEIAMARKICDDVVRHKDLGCCAAAAIEVQSDDDSLNMKKFWQLLGKPSEALVTNAGEADEDECIENGLIKTNRIYEFYNHTLRPIKDCWGCVPKHSMLQHNKLLVFDFGSELYIWCGRNCSPEEKKAALKLTDEYHKQPADYSSCMLNPINYTQMIGSVKDAKEVPLNLLERPKWCLKGKVSHNMETILFRQKFSDWPELEIETLETDYLSKQPSSYISSLDGAALFKGSEYTEPNIQMENSNLGRGDCYYDEDSRRQFDVVTKSINKWLVNESSHESLEPIDMAHFFSAHSYIIRWMYVINVQVRSLKKRVQNAITTGRDRYAYFCWQGSDSTANEKGAAALLAVELNKEKGTQVRVSQGTESTVFLRLFKTMFIHKESRNQWLENSKSNRLYHIFGNLEEECLALEVTNNAENLRSRASMLLINGAEGIVYVWHGLKSAAHTKMLTEKIANGILEDEFLESTVVKVENECEESEDFKKCLPQIEDRTYLCLKEESEKSFDYTLRLFHFTSLRGPFSALEIENPLRTKDLLTPYPFQQSILYNANQPTSFLLDDGDTLWLWYGWWPKNSPCAHLDDNCSPQTENRASETRWLLERRAALETVKSYWNAKNESQPESEVKGFIVWAGLEPKEFKALFPVWTDNNDAKEASIADGRKDGASSLTEAFADLVEKTYSLSTLKLRPLPENVDPSHLELYLSDVDFESTFKMSKLAFADLPTWKKLDLKRQLELF